jgi:hypothetical protein
MTPVFERGQVTPQIEQVVPLEELARVHRRLDTGHGRGKIVIAIGGRRASRKGIDNAQREEPGMGVKRLARVANRSNNDQLVLMSAGMDVSEGTSATAT